MDKKTLTIGIAVFIILTIAIGVFYLFFRGFGLPVEIPFVETRMRISETLQIPETQRVISTEGRVVGDSSVVDVRLVPTKESERIVVPGAEFTVKSAYNKSLSEARSWQSDAKLSFIKSLGTVNIDGKSSSWQLVFISPKATSVNGYEIIIQRDKIVAKKAVPASGVGGIVPGKWIDSDEALKRLAELPQFAEATISAINFYYNADGKVWRYAIATSKGTTSVQAE